MLRCQMRAWRVWFRSLWKRILRTKLNSAVLLMYSRPSKTENCHSELLNVIILNLVKFIKKLIKIKIIANVDGFSVLQCASIKVLVHCFLPLIRNMMELWKISLDFQTFLLIGKVKISVLKFIFFWVFCIVQNGVKSQPKMQEIEFQQLNILTHWKGVSSFQFNSVQVKTLISGSRWINGHKILSKEELQWPTVWQSIKHCKMMHFSLLVMIQNSRKL